MFRLVALSPLLFVVSTVSMAGQIALTFDDAPLESQGVTMTSEEKTDRIINSLKSVGVESAMFFVTTSNIKDDASRARLKKYAAAGHSLGNHSHEHLSANELDSHDYLLDFYQSHLLLGNFENRSNFHRFPFLHYGRERDKRETIYNGLKELGYEIGYVTVDNYEWYINSRLVDASNKNIAIDYDRLKDLYIDVLWGAIEFYDQMAIKHLGRSPKHVLLLHENELAALFVADLVKFIRGKGWEIISPEEAYEDPIASEYTPQFTFNNQGRVAAIAASKGSNPQELRHAAESTEYLDSLLTQYEVFD